MDEKSRERNYVDAFSDYGMDERQIALQNKIMTQCFKILYYGTAILTVIWLCVPVLAETEIPTPYAALSYFLLAVVCSLIYSVRASRLGVINYLTASSWGSKSTVIFTLFAVVPAFLNLKNIRSGMNESSIVLIVMCVIAIIYNVILHFCGRRNIKTLDEDNDDED